MSASLQRPVWLLLSSAVLSALIYWFGLTRPYHLVAWRQTISAYGPGSEILAGLGARLAGNDLLTNVIVFKLVLVGSMAGCAGFIAAILRRLAPDQVLAGVTFFLWSPVVLYETSGQGHNDVAMLFWMLLALPWLYAIYALFDTWRQRRLREWREEVSL